jgi:hypothetical protein
MRIKEADLITEQLQELSGLNPFRHTRKREYIDVRATLAFLLRNNLNFTFNGIARYFKSKGKPYDHATALYAIENFDTYRMYNKQINLWIDEIAPSQDPLVHKKTLIKQNIKNLGERHIIRLEKIVNLMYEIDVKEKEVETLKD